MVEQGESENVFVYFHSLHSKKVKRIKRIKIGFFDLRMRGRARILFEEQFFFINKVSTYATDPFGSLGFPHLATLCAFTSVLFR